MKDIIPLFHVTLQKQYKKWLLIPIKGVFANDIIISKYLCTEAETNKDWNTRLLENEAGVSS